MTATVLSIILGIITLATIVVKWMIDRSKQEDEKKDAIDKQIDAITNADDVTRMGDRLRDS